jgi:hypothetical protein
MAAKPKKSANQPYKPNIYEQYQNRRSFIIDTVETPADRKNLKKDLTKAKADYVIAKKDKQSRAAGTAYSPAPMTAAAKKKAAALKGAKKQAGISIKKDTKKIAGAAGKVAGKVTSTAKKVVKAEVGAAKKAVKFVAKQAMPPSSNPILKSAKAVGKVIAGDPLIKNLINTKKANKK